MDFYELRNKYFSQVQRKMINDYKMGNIDFMESEELIDTIIERIGVYQDTDKSPPAMHDRGTPPTHRQ